MLKIKVEKGFAKDIERDKNSGNYKSADFELLKVIIGKLENLEDIELKYKRHALKGDMDGLECIHIKSDWLLIFTADDEFLTLVMLGKHTQVYKKFK
ncbi:MAG: type II toxin-antitoxin system YafQ family toxin [Campylobacterales bacterium]